MSKSHTDTDKDLDLIISDPREDEIGLPPIIIHETLDFIPLSELHPGFLTHRGDWRQLKQLTGDGAGIKVGVGDTGVDKIHLEGDLSGVVDAKDFTNSPHGFHDRHFHGSHVTGHIGARAGTGLVGLASSCDLVHAKVLGDNGSGSTRGIANGIRWMVDQGCHLINLSLGGSFSQEIEGACREAAEQGVIIFAAMGNEGTRGDGHPGNSRYTLGITAIDYNKRIANFSSRSDHAKYSGYGVQVLSCGLNGKYTRSSGTSMASPDVTGLTTLFYSHLLRSNQPLPRTLEDIEALFAPAVIDLGKPGHDREHGFGFIDIWKLLETIPVPDPDDPDPSPIPPFAIITTEDGTYISDPNGKVSQFVVGNTIIPLSLRKL